MARYIVNPYRAAISESASPRLNVPGEVLRCLAVFAALTATCLAVIGGLAIRYPGLQDSAPGSVPNWPAEAVMAVAPLAAFFGAVTVALALSLVVLERMERSQATGN